MAIKYQGKPLQLDTGKTHVVEVSLPRTLRVDLPFGAEQPEFKDDRFVLQSTDGAYKTVRTPAQAVKPQATRLTVEFPGLLTKKSYTLTHERPGQGQIGTFFHDRTFADLFPPPTSRRLPRKTEKMRTPEPSSGSWRRLATQTEDEVDGPVEEPEDGG